MSKYNLSINLDDENTLIVFDANAWLDLYNIPMIALQEIVNGINDHIEKFWIPNQVYAEYKRNQKTKKMQLWDCLKMQDHIHLKK